MRRNHHHSAPTPMRHTAPSPTPSRHAASSRCDPIMCLDWVNLLPVTIVWNFFIEALSSRRTVLVL